MVDTHCHLDVCKPDDAELVANARALGVGHIATVGMNEVSIERSVVAVYAHEEVDAIFDRLS